VALVSMAALERLDDSSPLERLDRSWEALRLSLRLTRRGGRGGQGAGTRRDCEARRRPEHGRRQVLRENRGASAQHGGAFDQD